MIFLLVCFYYFANARGGITIPKSNCRWLTAYDWEVELRCDGNEVAVGACSGGKNKDCPGNSVHQLKCCELPNYYYSNCNTFGTSWGVDNDCRNHGKELILEGSCASGKNPDCHGNYNLAECCSGHVGGKDIGPASECYWDYAGYGVPLECGRSDEVIIGRCSSGKNLDCPGKSSHGNLCCELDFVTTRSPREANTTIKCPGGVCDVPTVNEWILSPRDGHKPQLTISDLVSAANGSPKCNDMLEAFNTVGKMKVAFGCGLGPVTRGPPTTCDDAIATSIGKCHPVNSSCMILNVANNEHCLSNHGDLLLLEFMMG